MGILKTNIYDYSEDCCIRLWPVCVFLCLVYCIPLKAQKATIQGTIYSAESGETIPYANIIKDGTTTGTYSKDDGSFILHLEPGEIKLNITCLSYKDTTVVVQLEENQILEMDFVLREDQLMLGELVVNANRVANKVKQLAYLRNKQNEGLKSYIAQIYKIAILGPLDISDNDTTIQPNAFSERYSELRYMFEPERYSELLKANRASKNFFSEYDFFSTGGPPLNLNQGRVSLSILSEDITVIGPVSENAYKYYHLSDEAADSTYWGNDVVRISINPKTDNRPLFIGDIWFNEKSSQILKIDVTLNKYANTNNGLFSIQNLSYQQNYTKIDGYWLPERTILSADLNFLGTSNVLRYKDEWSWSDHQINPKNLDFDDLDLNTSLIEENAHKRKNVYWDSVSVFSRNSNSRLLTEAKNYTEKNRTLRLGMSFMSRFFRLPYELERFYLTNISDVWHYNRVEGHYLGVGLRTPVHSKYDYRVKLGYGFAIDEISYKISGLHFIPKTAFAPDITFQNEVIRQYQDFEYNQTPLDFLGFRQSVNSFLSGNPLNNYFRKEGWSAGLRYRFDVESFLRVLYLNQQHKSLSTNTRYSLFSNEFEQSLISNNSSLYPAQNGNLNGFSIQIHHDTRKYLRTQFLRDYNVRDFGWLADLKIEKGVSAWESDFDFTRYRAGLMFNIPVFSSHFIQADLTVAAADAGTPGQRMLTYNGYVLDDYVRKRPFNTVSYKEPIGYRTSTLNLKYRFGSSITRKIPISFIQKSGIMFSAFVSVGMLDQNTSLQPLLTPTKDNLQAEIGIASFKIFGFLYMEFSRRLAGDYGNEVGFVVLF